MGAMKRRQFISFLGSAVAGWPISVLGAQGKIPRVAVLFLGYPDPSIFEKGFRDGLSNLGYAEGQSIELIVRSAGGRSTALAPLAAELIAYNPKREMALRADFLIFVARNPLKRFDSEK